MRFTSAARHGDLAAFSMVCAGCLAGLGCGGGGGSGGSTPSVPRMPTTGGTARYLNTDALVDGGGDLMYRESFDTDGNGTWIAVWDWERPFTPMYGDTEIRMARSFDSGDTWSDPELLDPNAVSEYIEDRVPLIASDRAGNWVAIWRTYERSTEMVKLVVSRSTDNGATWSPSTRLDPNSGSLHERLARLETDRSGRWVATWSRYQGFPVVTVFPDWVTSMYSDDAGATWSEPVTISDQMDGRFTEGPELDTDGAGVWIALWSQIDPGTPVWGMSLHVSRSDDNGTTWSSPSSITSGGRSEGQPVVATDRRGNWVVVFSTSYTADGDIGTIRSADNGLTWTSPALLNSDAANDYINGGSLAAEDIFPDVATDGQGRWIAVWLYSLGTAGNALDHDIAVAESYDNGATWSSQMYLNPDANDDAETTIDWLPTIETDGENRWIAAWWRSGLEIPSGTDPDLMYSTDFIDGLP